MSRPKAKWKVEYEAQIAGLSNADLLNEIYSSSPDDYDGMYTAKGQSELNMLHAELTRRLQAIGFLPAPALPPVDPAAGT